MRKALKGVDTVAMTLAVAVAMGLAGCAVIVERPLTGTSIAAGSAPAAVAVKSLLSPASNFKAWVSPLQGDGPVKTPGPWVEVTSSFTLTPHNLDIAATGTLALTPGPYRFRAQACWFLGVSPSPFLPFNCVQSEVDVQAVQPLLAISPASLSLQAGDAPTVTVTASPPPGNDLTVMVSSALASTATMTIAADTASPVTSPTVTATSAGSSTLRAAAGTPYGTASIPITVKPVLSTITPMSGPSGTMVTVNGAGFVAPMFVHFGTASVATTPLSATQAKVTAPAGLAMGSTVQVTVQSAGQTGTAQLPFAVQSASVPGTLLFRGHATGIETIRFTPAVGSTPASFAVVASATVAATSPGLAVVGLTRSGSTLLRASANALESFTIGGTVAAPTLTVTGRSPATGTGSAGMSGTGADAAFLTGQLVRGADRGLEVYTPGTSPLAQVASVLNRPGASPVGISLLAHAPTSVLLRSTSSNLELWNLTNPAAPTLTSNNIAVFTAPLGSGLAWVTPGQTLVRGFSSGIQVLTLAGGQTTVTGMNNSGGAGSLQAVAAVSGGRIARTNGQNVEVYDLSFGANPVRCATSNAGFSSSTGVALAVDGTTLFRATETGIEAWDLSALTCSAAPLTGTLPAPVKFNTGLASATTGLGLAGPN